jgi:hypothetical protein
MKEEIYKAQIEKLANQINSMIGHPENPFREDVLEDLVKESFELIGQAPQPIIQW